MSPDDLARMAVSVELVEHGFPDGTDDLRRLVSKAIQDALGDASERLLRSEQLNAELARMLTELEWSSFDGWPECPECSAVRSRGHFDDCALSALLKKARTE